MFDRPDASPGGHVTMTDKCSTNENKKVDGRKLRRGKRGNYQRRRVDQPGLFVRYMQLLMAIMEVLDVPVYLSKKSNHIYTCRQKICLLVFRQRLKLSYEQFEKDLPNYKNVLNAIGLDTYYPEKSTLCRFENSLDPSIMEAVVNAFKAFCREKCILAVDGTAFSNFLRSAHFAKRCKDFGIKKEPRSYTKASLVGDISNHVVVSARISPFKKHDSTFIPEHTKDLVGMDISRMVLDKGYDGENIHNHLRSHLGCVTVIPVRQSRGNRGFSQHGFYRREMLRLLVPGGEYQETYNQRPQIECTNFMIKTHTGSHILARNDVSKENVGLCKVLAHNCKIVCEHDMDWRLRV